MWMWVAPHGNWKIKMLFTHWYYYLKERILQLVYHFIKKPFLLTFCAPSGDSVCLNLLLYRFYTFPVAPCCSVFFEDEDFYVSPKELLGREEGGVALLAGVKVVGLDVIKRSVRLEDGKNVTYDKCLIATGTL